MIGKEQNIRGFHINRNWHLFGHFSTINEYVWTKRLECEFKPMIFVLTRSTTMYK